MTRIVLRHVIIATAFVSNAGPLWAQAPRHSVARCGPHSVFVCAAALGRAASYDELEAVLPSSSREATLEELRVATEELGLVAEGLQWPSDLPSFRHGEAAAIIPVTAIDGRRHFVAVIASRGDQIQVVDFPGLPRWHFVDGLREDLRWDGAALLIATDARTLRSAGARRSTMPAVMGMLATGLFALGAVLRGVRTVRKRRLAPRSGQTLVELFVVTGVLGLVLGLTLPAIGRARAAAHRVECSNHLRQIGLATLSYSDVSSGVLPPALAAHRSRGGRVRRNLSAQARLLPYLDEATVWGAIDVSETGAGAAFGAPTSRLNAKLLGVTIPVFQCPADDAPEGGVNYRMCKGSTPGFHEVRSGERDGAFVGVARLHGCRLSEITDGLSSTSCFSERVVGDQDGSSYSPWSDRIIRDGGGALLPDDMKALCDTAPVAIDQAHMSHDGATWLLSGYQYTLYNHVLEPNSSTPDCFANAWAVTARSRHHGGVNSLYVDGSVRFVSGTIDRSVWRAGASIDGGDRANF